MILKDNKTFDVKVDAINGGVVRVDNDSDNEQQVESEEGEDQSIRGGLNNSNSSAAGGNISR